LEEDVWGKALGIPASRAWYFRNALAGPRALRGVKRDALFIFYIKNYHHTNVMHFYLIKIHHHTP
jgi:hypothetical protein